MLSCKLILRAPQKKWYKLFLKKVKFTISWSLSKILYDELRDAFWISVLVEAPNSEYNFIFYLICWNRWNSISFHIEIIHYVCQVWACHTRLNSISTYFFIWKKNCLGRPVIMAFEFVQQIHIFRRQRGTEGRGTQPLMGKFKQCFISFFS